MKNCYSSVAMLRILALACLILPLDVLAAHEEILIHDADDPTESESSTMKMALTGAGVGAVGFLTGAIVGEVIVGNNSEIPDLAPAVVLGSITGIVALPLGVHAGNKGRGSLLAVEATGIGIGALGWALYSGTSNEAVLPVAVLAQLFACILVEKTTTPEDIHISNHTDRHWQKARNSSSPQINVNLMPTREGLGLMFSGSF